MNFDEMTLQELRSVAKELGMKGISAMKKGELTDLLKAAEGHRQAERESAKEENSTADKAADKTVVEKKSAGKDVVASKVKMNRRNIDPRKESEGKRENENGRTRDNNRVEAVDMSLDSGKEANGILEVMSDGFGFIRCENYLPGENDIYVSPAQIKRFNLKSGDIIIGNTKVKTEKEKFAALLYIKTVNGYPIEAAMRRKNFEELTPIFPDERIKLENEHAHGVSMRIMDLLAPIGKGQRGMIVAPPKAGKTTLLKQIAVSISRTYKDMHLIVLLIDERPEEVTDIRETIEDRMWR